MSATFTRSDPADGRGGDGWVTPRGALANHTADAALQQFLLKPRIWDKDRGGAYKIRYAVGADVFGLYADEPSKNAAAARSELSIGNGEIFRDDPEEQKAAIAFALGSFICFKLQPDAPLLLLPPINDQVRRIARAIVAKMDEVDPQEKARVAGVVAEMVGRETSLDDKDIAQLVHQAMILSGPVQQIRRIKELLEQQRIRSAGTILPNTLEEPFRMALGRVTEPDEVKSLNTAKRDWWKRIRDAGKPDMLQAGEVAEAMARLELINRRLARSDNSQYRLLCRTRTIHW